jgi:hypothetical protein
MSVGLISPAAARPTKTMSHLNAQPGKLAASPHRRVSDLNAGIVHATVRATKAIALHPLRRLGARSASPQRLSAISAGWLGTWCHPPRRARWRGTKMGDASVGFDHAGLPARAQRQGECEHSGPARAPACSHAVMFARRHAQVTSCPHGVLPAKHYDHRKTCTHTSKPACRQGCCTVHRRARKSAIMHAHKSACMQVCAWACGLAGVLVCGHKVLAQGSFQKIIMISMTYTYSPPLTHSRAKRAAGGEAVLRGGGIRREAPRHRRRIRPGPGSRSCPAG